MDNDLHELEAELRRLRPVAPSEFLTQRVGRELHSSRHNFWGWAALPLAAAFVGMIMLKRESAVAPASAIQAPVVASAPAATPARSPAVFKPVSAQNVLYDQRDDGVVTLADGTSARRVRNSYVDTITWRNPRTQASLRWTVPRTEERVIPVNFQ